MEIIYKKKNYTQGHLRTLIKKRIKEWYNCRDIKEEFDIWSLRTVAKRWYWDTLESKSSAPINPYRKHKWANIIMFFCLKKYFNISVDECVDELKMKHWIIIPRSTCYYYIKKRWYFEKGKRVTKKFKEYDPWYLHVDISYWPKLGWKKQYIYVAIDRATRLIYIEIHDDKKADTAATFLKKAIDFMPFKIIKLLTDNWKEFTLKNHKWKVDLQWAFDKVCEYFEIEHRLTKPYHPRTNWMVEKSNDTIKSNTVWVHKYKTVNEMENDILQFMFFYNLFRRHWWVVKEWKWRTPFDALNYYYKRDTNAFKITPEAFKTNIYNMANLKKLQVLQHWNK